MYGYVYKGTNLINNKIYIGQHKSKSFDIKYYGSGKLWRRAIEKYGLSNIKLEILEWCETKEELSIKEAYYIKFFNSQNLDIGYNLLGNDTSPHAAEGTLNGMYGKKHSDETRKKLSEKAKQRSPQTEEQKKKHGRPGVPKSKEHKEKISRALKGKAPSNNTIDAVKKANSKQYEIFDSNFNFIKKVERQKDLLTFVDVNYFNSQLRECINSKKPYKEYYIVQR